MPSTGTGDPGSDFAEAPKRQQCHARHCCLPALSATALLPSRAQRHALAARLDAADAQYRIQFLWKLSMPMPVCDLGVGCQARLALPLQEISASPVVLPTSGPTGSGPSAGFGFAYGSGLPTPLDSGSSATRLATRALAVCVTQLQRPSHHLPSTSTCTCTLYT